MSQGNAKTTKKLKSVKRSIKPMCFLNVGSMEVDIDACGLLSLSLLRRPIERRFLFRARPFHQGVLVDH